MRGFIREHILLKHLTTHRIKTYPTTITGFERPDKCDLVLKNYNNDYVRFQVKGLTWNGTTLDGINTTIDCGIHNFQEAGLMIIQLKVGYTKLQTLKTLLSLLTRLIPTRYRFIPIKDLITTGISIVFRCPN
ncbi:MAG: hypothetical protein V8Q17_00375 [Acutalibacteraceae bacterium]